MAYGQKSGFSEDQLAVLRAHLDRMRDYRGLALLNTGIDTFLRVSDLTTLTVGTLRRKDGSWRREFEVGQKKARGRKVTCTLQPHTVAALAAYVAAYRLTDADVLFPVSTKTIERQVKGWAAMLGLDPTEYGTHSLRRTKAAILAHECSAAQLDHIRELLGHRWLSSTQAYLGTTKRKALDFAHSRTI